jgi:hypothetical protein
MGRDWWNGAPSSSTSTTGGFVGSMDIADAEVITQHLRDASITTAKVTDASIVSCKLSTNALTRSFVIPFTKLASTEAGSLRSSTFIVYQPIVPITLTGVQIFPMGAWENATCDHVTFFRNSSSCVANVGFKSIASTASLAGVASCVGSITNALIAANTVLTMKTNTSTCSITADASIVVHFTTTA